MIASVQPATSLQPAFRDYIGNMIVPGAAARLLSHYLGKSTASWSGFLRADRSPDAEEPRIAWHLHEGKPWYVAVDIYAFIAREDPLALDRGIPDSPREMNRFGFSAMVHLDIDFEDGVRPFVRLDSFQVDDDKPMRLTSGEARELAKSLLKAAEQCERDTPSVLLARLRGDPEAGPTTTTGASVTTGDKGLDRIFADLG